MSDPLVQIPHSDGDTSQTIRLNGRIYSRLRSSKFALTWTISSQRINVLFRKYASLMYKIE